MTTTWLRRISIATFPVVGLLVPLCVLVLVSGLVSASLRQTVTNDLVNLVVVVGIYVFVGNSGIVSFGQIGFMGIGAYGCAILCIPAATKAVILPSLPLHLATVTISPTWSVLIAGAVAGLFALLCGVPIMRLAGLSASIATFALLVVVQVVLSNWTSVTLGQSTMIGIPQFATLWVCLLAASVVITVAYVFQVSPLGVRLRAAREDEVAARSVGIGVVVERVVAFALSALIVGVGGALYAGSVGAFNPNDFYIDATVLAIAMLVVGGIGSLAGAVVGTVAVSMITEILSRLAQGVSLGGLKVTAPQGLTEVGVALAMLLVLIYRPLGLMAGRELRLGGEVPHNGSEHGRGFTSWWVGARTKETEGSTSDSEQ